MHRFSNDREALDFIAAQIADQAQRDGVTLSEVERKMLYFSETAWTLPGISEVSEEFDRDYDQGAFERKISGLIQNAVSSARKQQSEKFQGWVEAIRRLSTEDRFLLVMVKQARLGAPFRRNRILWRLWGGGHCWTNTFRGAQLGYAENLPRTRRLLLSARGEWKRKLCLLGGPGVRGNRL
jgi:hypothetical protein